MFKILIADDEGITVDALKFIIHKYFEGQCIIESAKTGREVIEISEAFRPDIAFMDIQMPGINGIDAITEIKQTQPNIIFIILSAYDKLSYAKTAIELGVFKYLNKPIDHKRIVEVLTSAMQQIQLQRRKRSEDLRIREKLETVIPIIENGFIYDLLFKEHFTEDIENFKSLLGISEDYGYMLSLIFGEKQEGNHMTNAAGVTVYIQEDYRDMRNLIEGYFPKAVVSNTMANKIAVYVPHDKPDLDYNDRTNLVNRASEMVQDFDARFNIRTRVGFGSAKAVKDMSDSYQEALNALIQTTRRIAHAEDIVVQVNYEKDYPIETERSIFRMVEMGKVEESVLEAKSFYNWMIEKSGGDENDIRLKVVEFILRAEKIAYETRGMDYVFRSRTNYLPLLNTYSLEEELREWFLEKIGQASRNVCNLKDEKSNSIIKRAINYIQNNYTKNIALDDVSLEIDVTPYYFSRLFKEETGINFVEYVTNLRIDKAKELLASVNSISMKEICIEVGYADPNYFSRLFRKHEGISPTEYREGILKWKKL